MSVIYYVLHKSVKKIIELALALMQHKMLQ